jgi:hypothetical protein
MTSRWKIQRTIRSLLDDFVERRMGPRDVMKECLMLGARWQWGWQQDIAIEAIDEYAKVTMEVVVNERR